MKSIFILFFAVLLPNYGYAKEPSKAKKSAFKVRVPAAPKKDDLLEIAKDTAAIEKEALALDYAISNHRRTLLEQTRTDHSIVVKLHLPAASAVSDLVFSIDTYPVYQFSKATAINTILSDLIVYDGPVTPGSHTIHVSARLSDASVGSKLLSDFKEVEQSLALQLPIDPFRKIIDVKIEKDDRDKLRATVSETDVHVNIAQDTTEGH
jgi:hypothetical protein